MKNNNHSMLTSRLRWFMFAMVLANIGSNMYEPLLPIYLRELNANVVQVGLFFTLAQIIPLALQILMNTWFLYATVHLMLLYGLLWWMHWREMFLRV